MHRGMSRNELNTSVDVAFGIGSGANLNLSIENDPALLGFGDLDIHLLLFPAVGATIRADVGAVRTGAIRPINVNGGVLTFSGGNAASLPKLPVFKTPTFDILFAFDTVDGSPTPIGVTWDPETNQLKASKPCYAAVKYSSYITSALEIFYTPLHEKLGSGSRTTFGVIAAFYPPNSITVYQVEPFNLDLGRDLIELYRLVRKVVINPDGQFEFPPNYPTDGRYTDPPKSLVIDTDQGIVVERVHEIGFMDRDGYCFAHRPDIIIHPPYDGLNGIGYKPRLICKVSQLAKDTFDTATIAKAAAFVASRGLGCKP